MEGKGEETWGRVEGRWGSKWGNDRLKRAVRKKRWRRDKRRRGKVSVEGESFKEK